MAFTSAVLVHSLVFTVLILVLVREVFPKPLGCLFPQLYSVLENFMIQNSVVVLVRNRKTDLRLVYILLRRHTGIWELFVSIIGRQVLLYSLYYFLDPALQYVGADSGLPICPVLLY